MKPGGECLDGEGLGQQGHSRLEPSVDDERSIARALERGADNFKGAIGFLIIAGATLLPWALLAGLMVWLWRRLRIGAWLSRRSDEAFAKEQ